MAPTNATVLTKMANAFHDLANDVNSRSTPLSLKKFCCACELLSPLIRCMRISSAYNEFTAKVGELTTASESIKTIKALIDQDIQRNAGMGSNSNSLNLIRVNRSVTMVRIVCEQILVKGGNSLTDPVLTAYDQVFAPYDGFLKQAGFHIMTHVQNLPTKADLLEELREKEASANVQMKKFVNASSAVIQYIDNLFHSTEYGDELLGMI